MPGQNFTGLSGNSFTRTYAQAFINERSYRYRVVYSDEAGNIGTPATSTSILQMDNVDPLSGVIYTGTSAVWYNTSQTITFGASDNYSGVNNARYCTTTVGGSCSPFPSGLVFPTSRTFTPETELSLYIGVIDNATNESLIERVDILVEDNIPT